MICVASELGTRYAVGPVQYHEIGRFMLSYTSLASLMRINIALKALNCSCFGKNIAKVNPGGCFWCLFEMVLWPQSQVIPALKSPEHARLRPNSAVLRPQDRVIYTGSLI